MSSTQDESNEPVVVLAAETQYEKDKRKFERGKQTKWSETMEEKLVAAVMIYKGYIKTAANFDHKYKEVKDRLLKDREFFDPSDPSKPNILGKKFSTLNF